MSLEQALAANTAAIEKLHDAFLNVAEALAGIRTNVVAQTYAEQKAIHAEPPLTAPEAAKATKAVIEKAAQKAEPEPAPVAEAMTYEKDVRPTFTELMARKGPSAIVAILQKFGVSKGTELSATDLPAALASAQLELAS